MVDPRLAPVGLEDLDAEQRRLLGPYIGVVDPLPNVLLTMVRHPSLFEAWLPMAAALLNATSFTERQRELLIMRTAVVAGSDYEWGQHVAMSQAVLSDEDRSRVLAGPGAAGWTPLESALLSAVDELHASGTITDETWSRLTADLDERQLIELPILVGHYHMLALMISALGVQPEPGCPPIPTGG